MIDPERLYSVSAVREIVPGRGRGGRPTTGTVHRWIREGLLPATRVRNGIHSCVYIIRGIDLIKFLGMEQMPWVDRRQHPLERQRLHERALEALRKRGLDV